MNLIRSIISVFLVTLIWLSIAGWNWAGDLPADRMGGARFALAVCGLVSVAALALIWSFRQPTVETA